jgi:hypothetical protein
MLLLLLAGLILCIMLFHYKSKRKFIDLPGAGLQLPLIGHYQVSGPLIGWSYAVYNALPLQIQEEVYRPSRGWPSAASHWPLPGKLPSHWSLPGKLHSHWSLPGKLPSHWSLPGKLHSHRLVLFCV